MTNKDLELQKAPYFLPIEAINGIKFTPREIDIIACVLGRKTAKKMAVSLHISPKTVENHIRNIMQKLECNSREGIIDFTERSKEAPLLKQRYTQLNCFEAFEQSLKELSAQTKKNHASCSFIDASEEKDHGLLTLKLEHHLKNAGVPIETRDKSTITSLDSLKNDRDARPENFLLYILSKNLVQKIQTTAEFSQLLQKESKDEGCVQLLIYNKKNNATTIVQFFTNEPKNTEELMSYYYTFFDIIKCFFPTLQWVEIFTTLKNRCAGAGDVLNVDSSHQQHETSLQELREISTAAPSIPTLRLKKWRLPLAVVLGLTVCLSAGFISVKHRTERSHSDLILPIKFTLNRPELMDEINEKLKKQNGLQTIALVGLAGSGKKVLARQYAREQDAEIVWEINAEGQETLLSSFERLAYSLSKSDVDQQALKTLLDTKNAQKREDRLLLFIREKMNAFSNWIFIFYNANDFHNIQKYMPQDCEWGPGKVIITTTDNNIQNNKYVNQIVQVGELNEAQQMELFIKILNKGSSEQFTLDQKKVIKKFLNQIPPFPLDVSIAAYYIKETKTPYDTYIKYLNAHTPEFHQLQENVLKGTGGYEKTRHHIVSLSLKKLINSNPQYKNLLLFISLLDSKNIPRDLLYSYKDRLVVDNFIHDLNKYSLVIFTLYDLDQNVPTFSLHKNIKENISYYLNSDLKEAEDENSIPLIFTALEKYTDEIIRKEDHTRMQLMLNHCLKFAKQNQENKSVAEGRTGLIIGTLYYYTGNFLKSKEIFSKSIEILSSCSNSSYSALGSGLARLGNLYREFGQYEEAKRILERGLLLYTQKLPNDYIGRAFVLRHLARVYRSLGHYEKAKSLIEESLILYKNVFPTDSSQIAHSQAYLGKLYKDLGFFSKAKSLLQSTYDFSVKHYGQEHPRTARVLRDLGQAYYLDGDVSNGETLTHQALDIFQKYDHLERYTVFENLAEFHLQKSRNALEKKEFKQAEHLKREAQTYLHQALEVIRAHFPPDSPQITRIQSKITNLER